MGGVIRKATESAAKAASKSTKSTKSPTSADAAERAASKATEEPAAPAKAKAKAKATGAKSKGPVATPSADALAAQAEARRREEEAPPPPPPPSRPLTEAEQATVDQASAEIRTATIVEPERQNALPLIRPEAGSEELREQLEAHPELADEILAASGESLDAINEAINEPGQDQAVINATVDNLAQATEKAGDYGQARLGQTVAPASGNSDHIAVALASSQAPGAARLTETTSHNLPEGARANFRANVTTVREAARTVGLEYGPSNVYHTESPERGAAALQAQVEAHPELASMITLASQPTLERMATYLQAHPGETAAIQATTRSFSAVADATGQEADDLLVDTLAVLPPDNEGLLGGIAQASLDNQVDLGSELAERHGETAGAALERATQVGTQVQDIDAMLASGDLEGAYAASQAMRAAATDVPPSVATAILQGLDDLGTMDRLTAILGSSAAGADGNYEVGFLPGHPAQLFDGVVQDLSFLATRSGDLDLTQELGRDLAGAMNPDDIERFDEAFRNAVFTGQGADLTAAVIEELSAAGRTDQAEHVLDELDRGLHDLQDYFHGQADRRDEAFAELGYLQQQFGPLGTEAEQTAAAQAFLDNFPEIDEVERLGGVMATDLDVIARLRESVPDLNVGQLDDNEEDMLREFPRFANTEAGSAVVAEALEAQSNGHSTFLDRLTTVDLEGEDRAAFMEETGLALNRSALQQASAAVATSNPERAQLILDGLLNLTGAAEIQGVENISDLEPLIDAMGEVAAAGAADNPPPSVYQSAQNSLNTAMAELRDRMPGLDLTNSPRLRLLTGGTAILGAAGVATGGVPDGFDEWLGTIATASESGFQVAELVQGIRGANGAAFGIGAKVAGFAGAFASVISAVYAAEDGDYAAAGLHAGAAVGGALVTLGSSAAVTGVGAVLVFGAAAGLYQLGRVRASNVHENGNTEAYIRELIPDADDAVIRHLRNADDEGVNSGIVFQAAAQRLGLDPPEFFDQLSRLEPDQVLELVESAHALVSDDRREVGDLTQTHPSDSHVGEFVQYMQGSYDYYLLDEEGRISGQPLTPDQQEDLTAHLRDQYRIKYSPEGDGLYGLPMGTSVIAPASVQGWINYYEYLTGESLG